MARWMDGTVQLTAPVRLAALGTTVSSDRDPFISADNLRLYLASDRTGGGDIYVATRANPTLPFGAPVIASDLNSTADDSKLSITADDLTAVEASARTGSLGPTDLWIATRATVGAAFSAFTRTPFGATNDSDRQLDPEINGNGTRVYFAYGTPQRIVVISRANAAAAFGSMVDLIDSGGDADPSVSPDERLILFASDRTGGLGGGDLWYAVRGSATTTTFDAIRLVPMVNGAGSDGDPSLSDDGCTLYFASFRTGDWEVYVSTVTP